MWSEKLDNGKIKYVERYTNPLTLKSKKVSITLSGKDTAANRKLALEELQRKINVACTVKSCDNTTLKDLFDAYMIRQKETVKPSTCTRNRRTLSHLLDLFGQDSIVNNLTAQYIKDTLIKKGYEASTMNEYIRRFKAMINWGYENDYCNNPELMKKLKPFKDTPHRYKIQDKFLEEDELKKLLTYMKMTERWHWYYLTQFLVLTGLRIGEATALNMSDVGKEYIHVTKSYDVVNQLVTTPKTEMSARDVFIQPELNMMLKKYKLWRKEQMREYGICTNHLFFAKDGDYLCYGSYNKYLREVSEDVLGRNIVPHTLRHTHASMLMASGVDIETISRRLGHENSSITREIYLHVMEKLRERDNEQIKNIKLL